MTDVCPNPQKTAFPSKRQATRALRSIRHPHGRMKVYRCGSHWHLGHRDRLDKTIRRRNEDGTNQRPA